MKKLGFLLSVLLLFLCCAGCGDNETPPPDPPAEPAFSHLLPVRGTAEKLGELDENYGLQNVGGVLIEDRGEDGGYRNIVENFYNMYHADVVKVDDADYPYRMYFFGWAASFTNQGWPGADAIFLARGKNIDEWEIWSSDDDYTERYRALRGADATPSYDVEVLKTMEYYWDTEMDPQKWSPIIFADLNTYYDNWHNGDPSVVIKDGTYYMAYSGYGTDLDGVIGGADGDLSVVMGATSEDGIFWTKSEEPILIWEDEIGRDEPFTGSGRDYAVRPFYGVYHRPSMIWDEEAGRFKIWFDYISDYRPGVACTMSMGYAENAGDPMKKADWNILKKDGDPALYAFPNPDVEKIGDLYYAVGDPNGADHGIQSDRIPTSGWNSRQVVEAMSPDGINWTVTGYIEPDDDTQANQIPTLYYEDGILVLFYSPQVGNTRDPEWDRLGNTYYNEATYQYEYFAIRYKLRYWDFQLEYGQRYWTFS